ncbi:MAG: hypothetical protein Q8P30_00375 [Candidatus Uhrbacteria bacterium]|nr:hypothetical protein [Candidatus Uhrbacteria bacterium]
MNLKEKMDKFNKRWSITSADSYEDAFRKFKTRILNIFQNIDQHVTDGSITAFCQFYGIKEVWHSQTYGDHSWSTNISDRLNQENDEKEFYKLIELIFSLDITQAGGYGGETTYSKNILFRKVVEAIDLSDTNVSIIAKDGEVVLYPKGEKKLDEELVDSPLSFLNKESAEHLIQALQFYQSKKHIKSAESLRRSLEEFLRHKLKNAKGLNGNITELQTKLKSDKRDAQVRNIIGSIFSFLDQYFNENSKHNDGDIDDSENEFLIYQTGLLMRYVNTNI